MELLLRSNSPILCAAHHKMYIRTLCDTPAAQSGIGWNTSFSFTPWGTQRTILSCFQDWPRLRETKTVKLQRCQACVRGFPYHKRFIDEVRISSFVQPVDPNEILRWGILSTLLVGQSRRASFCCSRNLTVRIYQKGEAYMAIRQLNGNIFFDVLDIHFSALVGSRASGGSKIPQRA